MLLSPDPTQDIVRDVHIDQAEQQTMWYEGRNETQHPDTEPAKTMKLLKETVRVFPIDYVAKRNSNE